MIISLSLTEIESEQENDSLLSLPSKQGNQSLRTIICKTQFLTTNT